MTSPYYGHKTMADGTHVPLSREEAKALWEECEQAVVQRAEAMPTFKEALTAISIAEQRMTELGWSRGQHCPKDGARFAVVQFGSAGVFLAHFHGDWPGGRIWMGDESAPPDACMWKSLDKLTEDERAMMEKCKADQVAWIERQFKMFDTMDGAEG